MHLTKRVVGILAVTATALAACSGSSSGTKAGSASPTTAGDTTPAVAPGVTATEIHIGGIDYKSFFADAEVGARARIKRENDAGGVNGRKIILDKMVDDGADSTQDISIARSLVQQDHEFIVAPVMTASFSAADYLEQQKVPFMGWAIQPVWCGKHYGIGFEGNDCDPTVQAQIPDTVAIEQKLFPDGTAQGKTVALVSEDNSSASSSLKLFALPWQAHGAKIVLTDSSLPTPPAVVGDFTPYAARILTSNGGKAPDLVEMSMQVSDTLGLYKKLVDLGYKGIVQNYTLYDPRLAAATKGLVTAVQFAPFEQAGTVPAVQQMVNDLKAQDPQVILDQPAAAGYWTMDLLIQLLKRAGPDLTRASFVKAAQGFTYDYGGAVGPVRIPDPVSSGGACAAYVRSNGATFDVAVPLTCAGTIPNPLKH